MSTCKRSTLIR